MPGAQVVVSFPVIKSVMAGLAGEIHERTDSAEALAAYNWHWFEGNFRE